MVIRLTLITYAIAYLIIVKVKGFKQTTSFPVIYTMNDNTRAIFIYKKLAAQSAAWRGCVGAVTVYLKLTSYIRRLQLITQSVNGTA